MKEINMLTNSGEQICHFTKKMPLMSHFSLQKKSSVLHLQQAHHRTVRATLDKQRNRKAPPTETPAPSTEEEERCNCSHTDK